MSTQNEKNQLISEHCIKNSTTIRVFFVHYAEFQNQ